MKSKAFRYILVILAIILIFYFLLFIGLLVWNYCVLLMNSSTPSTLVTTSGYDRITTYEYFLNPLPYIRESIGGLIIVLIVLIGLPLLLYFSLFFLILFTIQAQSTNFISNGSPTGGGLFGIAIIVEIVLFFILLMNIIKIYKAYFHILYEIFYWLLS